MTMAMSWSTMGISGTSTQMILPNNNNGYGYGYSDSLNNLVPQKNIKSEQEYKKKIAALENKLKTMTKKNKKQNINVEVAGDRDIDIR